MKSLVPVLTLLIALVAGYFGSGAFTPAPAVSPAATQSAVHAVLPPALQNAPTPDLLPTTTTTTPATDTVPVLSVPSASTITPPVSPVISGQAGGGTRDAVLDAVPDDQLVIVYEIGPDYLAGTDLAGNPVTVQNELTKRVGFGEWYQKFRYNFYSEFTDVMTDAELDILYSSGRPEKGSDLLGFRYLMIAKGYDDGNYIPSPNNHFGLYVTTHCSLLGDSECDIEPIHYLYDRFTREMKPLPREPKGWFIKSEYLQENIPPSLFDRDFSLGTTKSMPIGVVGVIPALCGYQSGQYLWNIPIGYRMPFPYGKAKYISRTGPVGLAESCNANPGVDVDCDNGGYPSSVVQNGYCNRPGIHRPDVPLPIGSQRQLTDNTYICPHKTCGHKWPVTDFADGGVYPSDPEVHDTIYASFDGLITIATVGGSNAVYVEQKHIHNGIEFFTRYIHLDQEFVSVGQYVQRGQPIGTEGSTGTDAEHLHIDTYQYENLSLETSRIFFYPLYDEYNGSAPETGYVYTSWNGPGGTLSCNSTLLQCDVEVAGTTMGGTTRTETYGIINSTLIYNLYRGPEKLYRYQHTGGMMQVKLTNAYANARVFLFDKLPCDKLDPLIHVINATANGFTVPNLPSGLYYILIDTKGDTRTTPGGSFTLRVKSQQCVTNPCNMTVSATIQKLPKCGPPLQYGKVKINVIGQGQTGILSYAWSDGFTTTNSTRDGITPGIYAVTVTNAQNGCSQTATNIIVQQPGWQPPTVVCRPSVTVNLSNGPVTLSVADVVLSAIGSNATAVINTGNQNATNMVTCQLQSQTVTATVMNCFGQQSTCTAPLVKQGCYDCPVPAIMLEDQEYDICMEYYWEAPGFQVSLEPMEWLVLSQEIQAEYNVDNPGCDMSLMWAFLPPLQNPDGPTAEFDWPFTIYNTNTGTWTNYATHFTVNQIDCGYYDWYATIDDPYYLQDCSDPDQEIVDEINSILINYNSILPWYAQSAVLLPYIEILSIVPVGAWKKVTIRFSVAHGSSELDYVTKIIWYPPGCNPLQDDDIMERSVVVDGAVPLLSSPMTIYPNPATDQVTVIAGPGQEGVLYGSSGQVVRRFMLDDAGRASVSVGDILPGMYWVRVGEHARKLIVQ